ncbi:ArsR/SmtB family transcription factor [Ilumatobacter sp.]|uniref:ArsR/SmtB family transcription factor n=1 Tax=Ilumatobacter sp. TaxID=1967498 RepID=UPI003B52FEC1
MSATIQHAAPIATAAKLFCGFGDPTRLAIITTLADGEQRVSDIVTALNGSQGNISGHLKCLRECGLVTDRRVGREVHYRIAHDEVIDVVRSAERLLAVTGESISVRTTPPTPTREQPMTVSRFHVAGMDCAAEEQSLSELHHQPQRVSSR